MAKTKKSSASGTSTKTVAEIKQWFNENRSEVEMFAKEKNNIMNLRDVNQRTNKTISVINKETLKSYFSNISSNEVGMRNMSRYLYYRSNIYYRLVNWYADMWNLKCRLITPKYDLIKDNDEAKFLKSFNDTLDKLDLMNMQGNMTERLINIYIQDVSYAICFMDDTGMFFYELNPDECIIDSRYMTGDFGFSVDMSKWKSPQRQKIIEFLGSPLKEMYSEYERTNVKYVHMPDEYASCFKFRTDTWDTCIPPFIALFLQLAALEDLVDIQAEADALSIYKLIYLPMKVLNNAKTTDDFEVTPDISLEYLDRLISDQAVPDGVAVAAVPGDELKVIDFSKTVDSDTNSVEKASNQILQTSGGGAVINSNNITSTAAFNAWLKSETEFAISSLIPQVNGFVNRKLSYELSNPAKVEHFEVSVYTQKELAEQLLSANQYSYSYRLAYGTLCNISEKQTLAQLYLETQVLKLQDLMKFPLSSSFTQTGGNTEDGYTSETGQGRPVVDDDKLSDSGERSRNA